MPVETRSTLQRAGASEEGRAVPRRLLLEEAGRDEPAQRGGRDGTMFEAPVSTPRRSVHNRSGFSQNREYDLGSHQAATGRPTREERSRKEDLVSALVSAYAEDTSTFGEWKPTISIGDPLSLPGENLSRIQFADRNIAQWRSILAYHQGSSHIETFLAKAIEERLALDENDMDNTQPISSLSSTAEKAITDRVNFLEGSLASTENELQLINMRGAMAAYRSGEIPYSSSYTVLYAGQVVDTCDTYASTLGDRGKRLERYAAAHGTGAIWFEPPLAPRDGVAAAKKGVCLENPPDRRDAGGYTGEGFYNLRMGFRPRKALVTYDAYSRPQRHKHATPMNESWLATRPDDAAGLTVFTIMLDSGANNPLLFEDDVAAMGIDKKTYPAQSRWRVLAANQREFDVDVYELDVAILGNDDSSLVEQAHDMRKRMWPSEGESITTTVLVHVVPGSPPPPSSGLIAMQCRLSGMLPFVVCYMSSAPANFRLWMGEDRLDVLGAGKMPGQQKYSGIKREKAPQPKRLDSGHPDWVRTLEDTPQAVIFEHLLSDGQILRDEDLAHGKSLLTLGPKAITISRVQPGPGVQFATIEPRESPEQQLFVSRREAENVKLKEQEAALRAALKTPADRAVLLADQEPDKRNKHGKRELGSSHYNGPRTPKKQATEYPPPWWRLFD